jgi:acyl-CoA thioesterase FadM
MIASEAEFRRRFSVYFEHEVEYREIDMLRHVNNIRYCDWAETLRARFFDDVFEFSFLDTHSVIIARHDMHYDAPVAYRDRVLVGGGVTRWGTKSFDFVTVVWSLADQRQAFHSTATLVAYDYSINASIVVPARWRERAGTLVLDDETSAPPSSPRA